MYAQLPRLPMHVIILRRSHIGHPEDWKMALTDLARDPDRNMHPFQDGTLWPLAGTPPYFVRWDYYTFISQLYSSRIAAGTTVLLRHCHSMIGRPIPTGSRTAYLDAFTLHLLTTPLSPQSIQHVPFRNSCRSVSALSFYRSVVKHGRSRASHTI
jgi:hypothetical protein